VSAVRPEAPRPAGRPQVRLTVKVERRRGVARAVGTAPRGGTLRLRISGCARTSRAARTLVVRVGARGRFSRRLGSARGLRGCRVSGRLSGASAATVVAPA
jgi:hypothetical protein